MSLNQISLTPQLLADLYANSLIETHAKPVPVDPIIPVATSTINYLGDNQKRILIVVNHDQVAYLTDDELSFFTKVLNACDLSLADVAIVNWCNLEEKNYTTVIKELQSKKILLFNLTPIEFGLPLHFPPFQIQEFDKHTYLQAPSLASIEQDVATKKQLWTALKKLFAI